VIISWWDYGYWFAVMGNRTTLVDNSTSNSTAIAQVGRLLMSPAPQAAALAKRLAYDASCQCTRPVYVAIFISGSVVPLTSSQGAPSTNYYTLQVPSGGWFGAGGADESKKQWFIRIGGLNEAKFLDCPVVNNTCQYIDDFNLSPYALTNNNTLFASLFPFKWNGQYLNLIQSGTSIGAQLESTYQFGYQGTAPVETFTPGYNYGPNSQKYFRLAYVSPSLSSPFLCSSPPSQISCFTTILVYQVL
jgi:dolichyl-diphosphooligosaccharide--protein glycosyltransferase